MNRKEVLQLLSDKLKEITFLEDSNILFGKQKYEDLTFGTYFIDYSDNDFDFDLRDYQEKYISSEYYKNSGNNQWNFYLIFIRDSYFDVDKLRVEKDSIYTRKFIFTPDELTDYFDYQKSDKAVDADIVNIWKEKLKAVDLDEVYSDTPYTQAIPRYLINEVIKDEETNQVPTTTNPDLSIKRISSLKLNENYRKYPLKREFSLGKVNLIKGVNGTGKTSFLEAIELVVAGKNFSNPSSTEEQNCINAVYDNNNEFIDSYVPSDNAKYRQRDTAWYSSAYKSGNEVYRAFNRYNFYDSDAAYNLSQNSDVNSLSKYFSSIALGPEFNRIQDRMSGFKERLLKENNNRKKIIEDTEKSIKDASQVIETIKINSNPDYKFKTFIDYSKEINWNKELPNKYDDNYNDFNQNYQTAQSYINTLNQFLPIIKLRNQISWIEELVKIEIALKKCDEIKEEITSYKKIIKNNDEVLTTLNLNHQILHLAKKYFDEQLSFKLLGLRSKMTNLSIEVKRDSRALEIVENITDQDIFNDNISLINFKTIQLNKQDNLIEKQKNLKTQIENLKNNLNKLQGIVSEIKTFGKQFIDLKKDAKECPLCETKYSHIELSDRISKIEKDIKENVAIDEISDQLIRTDKELAIINTKVRNIDLIEKAISTLNKEDDYLKLKLTEIELLFNLSKERKKERKCISI